MSGAEVMERADKTTRAAPSKALEPASSGHVILTLSCPNRPGIVAAVSTYLFDRGANILEATQFDDTGSGRFFMRVVVNPVGEGFSLDGLRAGFTAIGGEFDMDWSMRARNEKRRVMILVSKFDHCLADLVYRWRIGELPMEIGAVVANHPRETYAHIDLGDIPFHHLPVTRATKMEQEARIWDLARETKSEVVVLARYMQVLSDGLAAKLSGLIGRAHV